ncbi:uncharacterized protein BT62DRAFT_937899, partial [Guyanagaster necrorhizus]
RWSLTRQQELLIGEEGGEALKPGIDGQKRLTDESGNEEETSGTDVSHESASAET